MRPWTANLLGLAIGFALGGAALLRFLPQLEAMRQPPSPTPAVAAPRPEVPREVAMAPPLPTPMPRVTAPTAPDWAAPADKPPLPRIIHPQRPHQALGTAGTGFFVADDGTLLTAAHVVTDCRRTQVVSRLVHMSPAQVVALDRHNDLALLQAENVQPPAVLPIGRPAGGAGRVFVLGYPASAGLRHPDETWGDLENRRLPAAAGRFGDPGFMIWLHAGAVTHGFSGGPILDPRNGVVVGLVRATVTGSALRELPGLPGSGIAIGPGSGRLIAFLHQQVPWLDVAPGDVTGDDAVKLARRATVHVLCWY